jgi:O-antigen ligase
MSLKEKPATIYGHNVIFLAMVIFLIFLGIGAGSDSPTFFGIVIILGSFVLVGLNLLYTPSLSGMGSTVLWFIICVALVLVKGSYKE